MQLNRQRFEGKRNGFTLIELLIVIVIISILAAIALPVMSRSILHAKRSRSNAEVRNMELAFKAYYNEYNEWRGQLSEGDIDMNMVNMLRGENIGDMNPHEKRFMEFNEKALKDGKGYLDSWKKVYRYKVDKTYTGKISVNGKADIHKSVAVYSAGEDKKFNTEDDIQSWD